jgi:predicted XRE-type DNA-binding protein
MKARKSTPRPRNPRAKSAAGELAPGLEDIKRRLVLGLLKMGASQQEIGTALGVNQSTVSRMAPGLPRKAPRKRPE